MTRREWVGVAAAAAASAQATAPPAAVVQRNDTAVERYLRTQVTDKQSRWYGGVPDQYALYPAGACSGLINAAAAGLVCPESRYRDSPDAFTSLRLAADYLKRSQSADGNINLESTNFNSPPDTGFVVWNVAEAASIARRAGNQTIERALQPFLLAAGRGMAKGGVHTPNHRWVVSSALAQINALWPDPAYTRRIEQWLAEGIDIDEDGQYTERSTTVYNTVCDRALVLMSTKLDRPELLDPVRRNLDSMLYLLHPGYEVVTEISRRQDLNQRGNMGRYWYPLAMLARRDANGQYETIARHFEAEYANLATMLDNPELLAPGPQPEAVPEDYRRLFRSLDLVRVRRGPVSASVLLTGTSRFFTLRRGTAVIEAVRFASAFFGKGQFIPSRWKQEGNAHVLRQDLEAPYYQPLAQRVAPGTWGQTRHERAVSEVCRLSQSATVLESKGGFQLKLRSEGTDGVPVAVEIGFREGGTLSGCEAISDGCWLLRGSEGTYRLGSDTIRFGPGSAVHKYVQVRGAEPKLPGMSVYLTGYTPFEHTLDFRFG